MLLRLEAYIMRIKVTSEVQSESESECDKDKKVKTINNEFEINKCKPVKNL